MREHNNEVMIYSEGEGVEAGKSKLTVVGLIKLFLSNSVQNTT